MKFLGTAILFMISLASAENTCYEAENSFKCYEMNANE